jgi:hypothetical protein
VAFYVEHCELGGPRVTALSRYFYPPYCNSVVDLIYLFSFLDLDCSDKQYICGLLRTPSSAELRSRVLGSGIPTGSIAVREVVADVQ